MDELKFFEISWSDDRGYRVTLPNFLKDGERTEVTLGEGVRLLVAEYERLEAELAGYRKLADRARHEHLGYRDGAPGTSDDIRKLMDETDECLRSCHSSIAHLLYKGV